MNPGVIAYGCPFVPPEWIAAHGLAPWRVLGGGAGGGGKSGALLAGREGVCPFMRGFVEEVIARRDLAGVVVTTLCDQMRRGAEIIAAHGSAPVFLMDVPATWQTPAPHRLYLDELRRLGAFLVRGGGRAPGAEALVQVMLRYDDARAAGALPSPDPPKGGPPSLARGEGSPVPLALLGGPLRRADMAVFDYVTRRGGAIVLDGTDTGERARPRRFDRRTLRGDPLAELADAYFGAIPHPYRRPNTALFEWLRRQLPARGVRGVIVWRYVWCDLWHAEVERLRQWTGLPLLNLDVDDANPGAPLDARLTGRLDAFLETLR